MDAKARIRKAMQAEARRALDGIPEGRQRREAVVEWVEQVSIATGYDVKTIGNWFEGRNAPTLQGYFDLCDYFGLDFEHAVRPHEDEPPTRDPIAMIEEATRMLRERGD